MNIQIFRKTPVTSGVLLYLHADTFAEYLEKDVFGSNPFLKN